MDLRKFSIRAGYPVTAHCKRNRPPEARYGNQNIDPSRTFLNTEAKGMMYNNQIVPFMPYRDAVRIWKRIHEGVTGKTLAKTANCLVSVVVTLPEDYKPPKGIDLKQWYTPERIRREDMFFRSVFGFLRDRFAVVMPFDKDGETRYFSNILYSCVHRDETSPHLHFGFIGVVKEDRKYLKTDGLSQRTIHVKAGSISAGEVTRREVLQTLHPDLDAHLKETVEWYHGGVLLSPEEREGKLKNVPMKEYKKLPEDFSERQKPQPVLLPMSILKPIRKRGGRSLTD